MDSHAASPTVHAPIYDPARHESQVMALFIDDAAAEQALWAVVNAGVARERVEVMADGAALHEGIRHPVQDLFVPEDDYHDYHHALGRGHAMVIVRPHSIEERDAAVWALEDASPMDLELHGRKWRGQSTLPTLGPRINHANVSRADMHNRAIGGHDEVILDMTGQKMTVRMMSDTDMADAAFAPVLQTVERPAPLAPSAPARTTPIRGTTYTYGVPADVVNRMTPEEQVLAQSPMQSPRRDTFLKEVGSHTQLGWRDRPPHAVQVRSYVSERPSEFREVDIHS
jgi:hypothetical protein